MFSRHSLLSWPKSGLLLSGKGSRRCLMACVILTLAAALPQQALGATVPAITKAEVKCIAGVPYPVISASIRSDESIEAAKVFFRSSQGENFYYVEMGLIDKGYQAILPVPSDETNRVVYYVEAVSASFESGRTEEYEAPVRDDCDEERFLGDDPAIVIYAVAEGAPIPIGFLSTGVSTTVSAAGVAAAVATGGGLGAGAITGIVIGGGLGAAAVVNELDDEDDPPASPGGR